MYKIRDFTCQKRRQRHKKETERELAHDIYLKIPVAQLDQRNLSRRGVFTVLGGIERKSFVLRYTSSFANFDGSKKIMVIMKVI